MVNSSFGFRFYGDARRPAVDRNVKSGREIDHKHGHTLL